MCSTKSETSGRAASTMAHFTTHLLLLLIPAHALGATINVEIAGTSTADGQLVVSLFNTDEAFLRDPVAEQVAPVDPAGSTVLTFSDVELGTYAIMVYHDEDRSGTLNTNFFGIPTEPVGASNNARRPFGPPTFADASFEVATETQNVTINLGAAR